MPILSTIFSVATFLHIDLYRQINHSVIVLRLARKYATMFSIIRKDMLNILNNIYKYINIFDIFYSTDIPINRTTFHNRCRCFCNRVHANARTEDTREQISCVFVTYNLRNLSYRPEALSATRSNEYVERNYHEREYMYAVAAKTACIWILRTSLSPAL